jgi:hypothetical protein
MIALYFAFTEPGGRVVVVIERAGAGVTVRVNARETGRGDDPLSVAVTVMFDVPEPLGVPTIVPDGFNVSPAGRLPPVSVNVRGATPPVTVIACR